MVVDEAHSIGVLGPTGRGILEHFRIDPRTIGVEILITGTLSKALGCFGGFVAGSRERVSAVRAHSSAFRASTPIPLFIAESALTALRRLMADDTVLADLRSNISVMRDILSGYHLVQALPSVPIFSVADGVRYDVKEMADSMKRAGVMVALVKGYSVAQSEPLLRWTVSRSHSSDDLASFAHALSTAIAGA